MDFKASLGQWAIGITVAVTVLFTGIVAGQFWFIKSEDGHALPAYTVAALLLVYAISYVFMVRKYSVTDDSLVVCRPFGIRTTIPKSDITSVQVLPKGAIGNALRIFGVGGLFGYSGKFYNSKYGTMTWYRTRTDKTVLITTLKNKKIVLSPDDPEAFAQALQKK